MLDFKILKYYKQVRMIDFERPDHRYSFAFSYRPSWWTGQGKFDLYVQHCRRPEGCSYFEEIGTEDLVVSSPRFESFSEFEVFADVLIDEYQRMYRLKLAKDVGPEDPSDEEK